MEMLPGRFDARTAIGYLIAAGGNSVLAAQRASRDYPHAGINEALLLTTVAADPSSTDLLAGQVRVLALLTTLDAFRLTHASYLEKLPNLSPKDTAHTYTRLLEALSSIINPNNLPPNPNSTSPYAQGGPLDSVLALIPPEARDAVQYFLQRPLTPDSSAPDASNEGSKARGHSSPPPTTSRQGIAPAPTRDKAISESELEAGSTELTEAEDSESESESEEPQLLHEFRSYGR